MATTSGEFIAKLASMAGISQSDPALVEILSSSEFSNSKIPDEISQRISSALFTMDAARNNETLRKHFHAEILNGLDNNIQSVIERYQLDPEITESINAEKKTTEKYNRLIEKMQDLQNRKSAAVTKTAKNEVENEIQNLNNQIKDLQSKLQNAPIERDQYWSEKLRAKAVQSLLGSYQYANEKDIPKDVLIETASVLLNKKLNESRIRLEYNTDQDNISLKTESGLDFYKDNTPVSFKSFVDGVLSESKLLTIPGASTPTPNAANPKPMPQNIVSGGGKSVDASKFYAAFDDVVNGR